MNCCSGKAKLKFMGNIIIEALESNGIGFDWVQYEQEVVKNKNDKLQAYIQELCSMLECSADSVMEPTRLIWRLYAKGLRPKSLSFEFLKANRNQNQIYDVLYKYKREKQFLSQYGEKLRDQIQADGRLHAHWTIDGAKTGRMTCSNPNLQGFPSFMKPYFKPQKGNCFLSGDYSQIELRILAELSGDENMIRSFQDGLDIHLQTASAIFAKAADDITEDERAVGKRVNFGICYGISAHGLCETIQKEAKLNLTLQEANTLKSNFYLTYPKIKDYHNHLLNASVIKSLSGQEWMDYPKGIARINLPVQASAAEGLKIALYDLLNNMPASCLLVNVIHDEIVLEISPDKADELKKLLENIMIAGMGHLLKNVPVLVDTKIIY